MDDSAFGPSPTLPARFGRYHVVATIPGGNMGRLYLAQDPEIDRMVVVKALDGDRSQDEKHRFLREARAAGRLSHANVVSIFDVGEQERTPFIVMEYIDGDTLANVIKNREPILFSRKLEMVDQLCAGLAYAHDQGVVHRDIKPSNLMIDKADVLRILDFGIARLDSAEHTQTSSGIVGTLNYMSPEQWEGGVIEQRSDIFAVGAVVYELISYTRAFPGSAPPEVLRAVFGDGPPPLEDIVPGTPPELSAIVRRMMARMPEDRYPSLHVVRAALDGLKARAREAEEQMLGETVHMERPPVPAGPATSQTRPQTSIGQTASLVRDLAAKRAATGVQQLPGTRTQTPVTRTQTAVTRTMAGGNDVTRTMTSAPVDVAPPPPTMVQVAPSAGGRALVFLGIVVAVVAIGLAGLVAWKVLGVGSAPAQTAAPGAVQPAPPVTSQSTPGGAGTTSAASTTPPPVTVPAAPPPAKTNAPSKTTEAGGHTAAAASDRSGAAAAAKPAHIVVSGPYAFELRQGGKVISESAARHELDVNVAGGAITARNAEYWLNAPINPRSSPIEIPGLGALVINTTPATRDACRLMIDGQDAGSPMQPAPGLRLASGTHQIGLKCGTELVDVTSREIAAGDEPTMIRLNKSPQGRL